MAHALRVDSAPVYARHAAAADRGSWSVITGVRWGEIDVRRATAQPEVLESVRLHALALSARSAATARTLAAVAEDPHASAALTLDMWDGLKHMYALRTYLDAVESSPRITDSELACSRRDRLVSLQPASLTVSLVALMHSQHRSATSLRSLGARTEESVLAELLALMAGDETRHAQITADLLAARLSEGTSTAAEVRDAVPTGTGSAQATEDLAALHVFGARIDSLLARSASGYSSSSPFSRT